MAELKYPFLNLADSNLRYMDEMVEAATRVIRSGRYIGGPEVESFEENLRSITGSNYAIGVSNGLDALRLILRAYIELGRIRQGDEVIVPANTYIASVLAISDAGLTPVPVDADIATMNIDTNLIEAAITDKTRAIMTVHLYGRVAWDGKMRDIAQRHNLIVIEDCAQAIGARATTPGLNGGAYAGALGDAGAFSFYPTKNIGALGDAGAVTTDDESLAKAVRALANYGSDRRYHNIYKGFNCRLDPIQAAMLNVKMSHVKEENADRFARALAYGRNIATPHVVTPLMSESVTDNVWHQYVIRIIGGKRDCIMEMLKEAGVGTDIHYATPPHMQPCYKGLRHSGLPVTEKLAGEIVSLPMGPGTTVKEAAEIAAIISGIQL